MSSSYSLGQVEKIHFANMQKRSKAREIIMQHKNGGLDILQMLDLVEAYPKDLAGRIALKMEGADK